jgi:hypothetical protein
MTGMAGRLLTPFSYEQPVVQSFTLLAESAI